MVDRWVQDHQKDAWRKQAKASGYRARSAFKLKQIQERHKIIDSQDSVLDVGCHPGGWAQVAVELVGENGKVVGVDLQSCVPVDGANLIVGDITEPFTQQAVLDAIDTEESLIVLGSSFIGLFSISFTLLIFFFLILFAFKESISFSRIKVELFTFASDEIVGLIS